MSTYPMGSRGDPLPSNRDDVRFLSSDVRGQIMEMKPKVREKRHHKKSPKCCVEKITTDSHVISWLLFIEQKQNVCGNLFEDGPIHMTTLLASSLIEWNKDSILRLAKGPFKMTLALAF
ncbi:hypothetical protein NPIL_513211 [Nephila pilipes]|uniref:Uncharacterized protein n=1 Tax=Nephila pilipes TaxID=299642 RepID=A0A8X6NAW6_NEPPI|nr:hypothetical protein NPIL_513211 [Nephila pilipes]